MKVNGPETKPSVSRSSPSNNNCCVIVSSLSLSLTLHCSNKGSFANTQFRFWFDLIRRSNPFTSGSSPALNCEGFYRLKSDSRRIT
ncbi:hypothetical protein L2E82_15739 [Cichorium intybus]|uniref:Uncharacterized protein n=1 Tax=Cichorium intybus TaxID=13427 RepID=A0ACB9F3L0_CICIN|nr:hypothetical protein L2E82_15739 [Cichorium intybus]